MRLLLVLFIFAGLFCAEAQTGSIVGKLTDKDFNNEPLPFANILVKGTIKGTTSDTDGLYELSNLDPGSYTVVFSFVGYETVEIETEVVAGKVTTINVPMGASAAALDEVVIKTTAKRDSEVALLIERKNAIEIKQTIGAQELSRKGVSDAEGAVTKISGVSKQEGVKNVFVRGLGDRYNATSLNGLPLPSDDPEYKNVSLDIFTTDIISSVDIQKVFGSRIYGEVGGANININSKEFSGSKGKLTVSSSAGINTRAVDENRFLRRDGSNYFASANERRSSITSLGRYDFENGYQPNQVDTRLNTSFGASYGNRVELKNDARLDFVVIGKMTNDFTFYEGVRRQVNSNAQIQQDLDYTESNYNATQLLMSNVKYRSGNEKLMLNLNSGYIHSGSEKLSENQGFDPAGGDDPETVTYLLRQQHNDNNLFINQLLGSYKANSNLSFNAAVAYNLLNGFEPDTKLNTFNLQDDGQYTIARNSAGDNQRLYIELEEQDISAQASATYGFGEEDNDLRPSVSIGYNYRNINQDFESVVLAHQFFGGQAFVDINNIDGVFNQGGIDSGLFELRTDRGFNDDALDPVFFNAEKTIHSAHSNFIYPVNQKLVFNFGIRLDDILQELDYNFAIQVGGNPSVGASNPIDESFILPSFSVKYSLTDNDIFRLSASQTYILPRFKEVAPFLYNDISFDSFGNPLLLNSNVYNVDLGFEHYFSSSEFISLTGYYKFIEDPINRIEISNAGSNLSYVNVPEAFVFGAELEFRKNLLNFDDTSSLEFGLNASYLYSEQKLEDVDTDNLTVFFARDEDQLEGASPFILNTDIKFEKMFSNDATLKTTAVLNYFYDRIFSIGVSGSENINELGVPTLDWITSYELASNLKFNLSLRNVLDPEFKLTKEAAGGGNEIDVLTFRKGVGISLGVSYQF